MTGQLLSLLALGGLASVLGTATDKVTQSPINTVTQDIGFGGIKFTMAVHEEHPFVFFDETKTGNDRFTGVTIELSQMLCELLECELDYYLADEQNPESAEAALEAIGAGKPVGSAHEADIAGGAIHITPARSNLVHFTLPYYDTGYVTVVPRPKEKAIELWSFLKPFTSDLWAALFIEIIVVGLIFTLFEAPWLTVEEDSDVVDGQYSSFFDCLYWSLSALTCTLDKAPKTWGGKLAMLAHGWFMLIIIASYTANLASFLTTNALVPSITGWPDVTSGGNKVKLATPQGLSHNDFLAFEAGHFNYQFNVVESTPTWEESMQAVTDGRADATFHDEAAVQYYMLNDMPTTPSCPLMMVGTTFNPTGYGLAFGLDSTAFLAFSQAILTLKENGEIAKLMESYGVGTAKATDAINNMCSASSSLSMKSREFYGLFIITGGLLVLSLIAGLLQRCKTPKEQESEPEAGPVAAAAVNDPGFETALNNALTVALKHSLDATFKAGLEAGLREGRKNPSVQLGFGSEKGSEMQSPAYIPTMSAAQVSSTRGPIVVIDHNRNGMSVVNGV